MNKKVLATNELEGYLGDLEQLTAILGFMETAFADGASVIEEEQASAALHHIYTDQQRIIALMRRVIAEGGTVA